MSDQTYSQQVHLRTTALEALDRFPGQTLSDRVLAATSEVDRLQAIIGELYEHRGDDHHELIQAIHRAFHSMRNAT